MAWVILSWVSCCQPSRCTMELFNFTIVIIKSLPCCSPLLAQAVVLLFCNCCYFGTYLATHWVVDLVVVLVVVEMAVVAIEVVVGIVGMVVYMNADVVVDMVLNVVVNTTVHVTVCMVVDYELECEHVNVGTHYDMDYESDAAKCGMYHVDIVMDHGVGHRFGGQKWIFWYSALGDIHTVMHHMVIAHAVCYCLQFVYTCWYLVDVY